MKCETCQGEISPDQPKCPLCGTQNPAFAVVDATLANFAPADATRPRGSSDRPSGPASDLLGFIVMYAESSDDTIGATEARYGRVYPMHSRDVLFIGKAPAPAEVVARDNAKLSPTLAHLFPFKDEYSHISRRHLVVQMEPGGRTGLTDLSTNGLYLVKGATHLRRAKGQDHTYHVVEGEETVVLGVDVGAATDKKALEKSTTYRLQILPLGGDSR